MSNQLARAREALAEFVAMTLFVWCGTGSALATNSVRYKCSVQSVLILIENAIINPIFNLHSACI